MTNLNFSQIKNAKPGDTEYKLSDGQSLFLIVKPSGAKLWQYRYRFEGKQKTYSIGEFPGVSLAEAREELARLRKLVKAGLDPMEEKRKAKIQPMIDEANTFRAVFEEWHAKKSVSDWSEKRSTVIRRLFEHDLLPDLGSMPINDITTPSLLVVLQKIEKRGVRYTAKRALENCKAIFNHAKRTGRSLHNPADGLNDALTGHKERHLPALTDPNEFRRLLHDIYHYQGSLIVQYALRLSVLVALRPGEVRNAEWCEVDLSAREWRIPAEKMKMDEPHMVPLSRQAVAILEAVRAITGHGPYVFPSYRNVARGDRPMSNNAVNYALVRMGYQGRHTAHGFRSTFSTLLYEMGGFSSEAIERQLAHGEHNKVKAAYLRGAFLEERKRLMQAWADYVDDLMEIRPRLRVVGAADE